jgi:hypothetical protein
VVFQAVGGHNSTTTPGRPRFASSQLAAAEVRVLLNGELSRMASECVGVPLDICAAVREREKMEEGNRPFSADTAASAASGQSPTVVTAVAWRRNDVKSATHWPAAEQRFDVDQWTCNRYGRSVGHSRGTSLQVRSMVVEANQRTRDASAWINGDGLASTWATRGVDKETPRLTLSFVKEEGVSPMRDDERRCSPEELHLIIWAMTAEGESAGIIIGISTSDWCGLLIVVVSKDQYGVLPGKLCVAAAYRRTDAWMKEGDPPSSLAVAMFAEPESVTLSAVDLTEGFGVLLMDLDPMCHDCGAVTVSTSDGLEKWKSVPSKIVRAPGPATGQREIQRVSMRERLNGSVLEHVVDVLVFSCKADACVDHVEWVLSQLLQNLSSRCAHPDRTWCDFLRCRVSCVGQCYGISAGGLAEQQATVDDVSERPGSRCRPKVVCVFMVRQCLGLSGYHSRFVAGQSSVSVLLLDPTCVDTSFTWEEKQGLKKWDHRASVNAASVVQDLSILIQRRKAIVLPLCSGIRVVPLRAAGTGEATWTAPSANDIVVDFERLRLSELSGYLSVEVKTEAQDWHRPSSESAEAAYVAVDVCDERKEVMIPLTSGRGRNAARHTAAKRRIDLDGSKWYGPCRRLRAVRPAKMSDPQRGECCVWGRGLGSKTAASLRWCLGERAEQGLPSVETVVGWGKYLLGRYTADVKVMSSTKHLRGYQRKLVCRFIGPLEVVSTGTGTGDVTLDLPRDMSIHESDVVNVDRVKRYVPSVGEWPSRVRHRRPLPVRVAYNSTGEYVVQAILDNKEELEYACDCAAAAEDGGQRKKKVMVFSYLLLWKGYSMGDCSGMRDSSLASALELLIDHERRLLAEEKWESWCDVIQYEAANGPMSRFLPVGPWKGMYGLCRIRRALGRLHCWYGLEMGSDEILQVPGALESAILRP